jgi:chemotaxis methyl-accepting protein methylase
LSFNARLWKHIPTPIAEAPPLRSYGEFLHSLVKLRYRRAQNHGTLFLRNRPQLELIQRHADERAYGAPLRVLVVACSNGAEVYSIVWKLRRSRPDLKLCATAVDISKEVVEVAREGRYWPRENKLVSAPIFERLTEDERQSLFDVEADHVRIKSWIRDGIHWNVADAADPELARRFGGQDIVVANNFLCHMDPPDAERCLRNISRSVKPGGLLCVAGVDLNVRAKVAADLNWAPVEQLVEETHDGDPSLRRDWPWRYWGLEPFSRRKRDWRIRYTSVFRCASSNGLPETGSEGRPESTPSSAVAR